MYMQRALELATRGRGFTNPNPLVGAIIVKEGRIIGEGYHQYLGGPHAEIHALQNATEDVSGSTLYVTLEPCSHYGRTPPCAEAIIKNKIAKVVIAMTDPNPLVSGKGIQLLQRQGIQVVTNVLKAEAMKVNEIFIKYIKTKEPFCILKTAMTMDGKIATVNGESKWITGEPSRNLVHQLRHQVSSIMVGIGTILNDDPSLTTRLEDGKGIDPIRIVVDSKARIPLNAKVLNIESDAKTIIITTEEADPIKLEALKKKGAQILITPSKDNMVDLCVLNKQLGQMGIDSLLLEGGSELNFSAINSSIVDKVITFIAPKIIGGRASKTPIGGIGIGDLSKAYTLEQVNVSKVGEDIMIEAYPRR